jgi:hypothetical protein
MWYRCRNCQHEEARGRLPTATCLWYPMGLLALAAMDVVCVAPVIRGRIGEPPASIDPADAPRWVASVTISIGVVLALAGAWAINVVLEWIEWIVVARQACPECGGRRWSRGFTRGFGL